ncbi:MAG: DUF1800 domain-containing protein [Thermoleophilia bacterium]|nr:DUF1800 domain-containing protein [Thermoleophilia bacterium]
MSTRVLRGARRRRLRRPLAAGPQKRMNKVMVDRMMWRTGFGPSNADRKKWIGRSVQDFVDELLTTPQGGLRGAAPYKQERDDDPRTPLDPTEDDTDLVLEWCDKMIRLKNPFAERMAFFWHNHFATQRSEVSPPQLMQQQIDLFRKYSDLVANPAAKFRDLLYEVGEGPAMLRFLNGEQSTKDEPNENYGREICELFAIGILDRLGRTTYGENDIKEISRAFTGWEIEDDDPDNVKAIFNEDRWDDTKKSIFGKKAAFRHRDGVDAVLAHWSHPYFIVTKLWNEFITLPPDKATVTDLIRTYKKGGTQIRPVIRKILTDPAMFANVEPDMIKPPIVYSVGAMRALGRGITSSQLSNALDEQGQEPYFPPTVAGWEGGLSWLNTNTALARFDFANALVNDDAYEIKDPGSSESHTAAFTNAWNAVGRPWLAPKTRSALLFFSKNAPADNEDDRIARQRVLRTFMVGGPDGQVM